MNDQRLFETLLGMGLTTDAARAYLLLTELGSTDLATLRSGLRISRNKTQAAIHELERKGFVTVVHGASPRYARNEDPNLLELLERTASDSVRAISPRGIPGEMRDGLRGT